MPRVSREGSGFGMNWSLSFLWTSPWKVPSPPKSFESSHGQNISSHEIRPEVWALFQWMWEIIPHQQTPCLRPGNYHGTDCLKEKQLSAMGKTLPWKGLFSKRDMIQEEGGGAWSMLHSWKPQEWGSWCLFTWSRPRSKPVVPRTADQSFGLSCARIVEVTFAPWATRCKCKNRNVWQD